jgi:tetratricopeptide (TPR) repeat protein
LGACAQVPERRDFVLERAAEEEYRLLAEDIYLWEPCTRSEAEAFAAEADTDGLAAVRAASCYLLLVTEETDGATRLADAKRGRTLAEAALKTYPESGGAHYLAAYLTALEAQNDRVRGLSLVPIIEREALAAAEFNPKVDHGGPDRMLGELYLRAPGLPMSVGDPAKAVVHYRRARDQDPNYPENRLGLIEALMAEDELKEACDELGEFLTEMPPQDEAKETWLRALGLMKQLCENLEFE